MFWNALSCYTNKLHKKWFSKRLCCRCTCCGNSHGKQTDYRVDGSWCINALTAGGGSTFVWDNDDNNNDIPELETLH